MIVASGRAALTLWTAAIAGEDQEVLEAKESEMDKQKSFSGS